MMTRKTLALAALGLLVLAACEKDENRRSSRNNPGFTDSTVTESSLFISSADSLLPGIGVVKRLEQFDTLTVYRNNAIDGNGIVVDTANNIVYQLSRKLSTVFVYNNASSLNTGVPSRTFKVNGLVSGRDMAYDATRNLLYISSNTDSAIVVINNPSTKSGSITPDRKLKLNGEPWGIALDEAGDRLFVAKDKTAMYQIYNAVSELDSTVSPSSQTTIVGATRTHGIAYDAANNVLVVTDINEASEGGFDSDGAFHVINPSFAIGLLNIVTPLRTVAGANTQMGNPVDVAFGNGSIYIAEKTQGGKVLRFALAATGNASPTAVIAYPGIPEAICLDLR